MRSETVVDERTAYRIARASTRYRVTSPAIYGAVLVELAVAAALWGSGRPGWALALAAFALTLPIALVLQTSSLARAMQRRGYRPGSRLSVDWDADTFTVSTPDAEGTHRYAFITSARQVGDAVVMRVRGARVLLALPDELVPDSVRATLGLTPRL